MLGPLEDALRHAGRIAGRPAGEAEGRASQRAAAAASRQYAARFLAHRSRPRAGQSGEEPISPRSPAISPRTSVPSASAPASTCTSTASRCRRPAYVDRDMWEKIVLNLLSNAFKFTFAGGIDVRLRDVGGRVELTVRDTGVGIPPPNCRMCSNASIASKASAGARTKAPASDWRWCTNSSTCMAATSRRERGRPRHDIHRGAALRRNADAVARHGRGARSRPRPGPPTYVEEALRWLPQAGAASPPSSGIVRDIRHASPGPGDLRRPAGARAGRRRQCRHARLSSRRLLAPRLRSRDRRQRRGGARGDPAGRGRICC